MPTSGQPIYGEVIVTRITDPDRGIFGMTIDRADPLILIDPELLEEFTRPDTSEPMSVVDDMLTLRGMGGVVTYRLAGWLDGCRIGERVDGNA
ncbi:MAG: hypothetical protein JWM36_4878 [Hyphomicrobiales bacterium]|jgi:hypothetical protein|nr:hypothetical protein [Hyphomicrobiales bacterium]